MKILAVVPYSISTMGYLRSQVINQFVYLESIGHDVTILSVGSDQIDCATYSDAGQTKCGVKKLLIKPGRFDVIAALKGIFPTIRLIRELQPNAIYVRDVWGALISFIARRLSGNQGIKIVYDVRGAIPEEIVFLSPSYMGIWKSRFLAMLEWMALKHASLVSAVTEELSEHLYIKYGRKADTVIPCCVDQVIPYNESNRIAIRNNFGFSENQMVYVYSGGLRRWQLFEESLDLFSRIAEIDKSARFLVLTPTKEQADKLLSCRLSSDQYRLISVRQEEVTTYLQAGDAGFMLRDDDVVNRVAFPIKFGEYLAAGLPVIVTDGVTEIAGIVRRKNIGIVISPRGERTHRLTEWGRDVMASREQWCTRCRTYVAQELTWGNYQQSFSTLYR